MAQKKPTKKQTLLLDFIKRFTAEHNYSPSYREIQAALGLRSVSAVAEHIDNCVAAGFLRKIPRSARSLEVLELRNDAEIVKAFRSKIAELTSSNPNSMNLQILRDAAIILELDLNEGL